VVKLSCSITSKETSHEKIKSKKYRRIRKKQRSPKKKPKGQVEDDPDLARELEEKERLMHAEHA
jgi:hypothetical protein